MELRFALFRFKARYIALRGWVVYSEEGIKIVAKKPKLEIELIPSTCWYSNVRTNFPNKVWDKLRKESYKLASHKCEICGDSGRNQGYKHDVECHEIWYYDDENKIQKLMGLISLCPLCHQTKHIGRSLKMGRQAIIFKHMEKVNNWSHKDVVTHLVESLDVHVERSKYVWKLDLSILAKHGVDKKLITEAEKKRVRG